MQWLKNLQRRRAIKTCARKMPRLLAKRYGRSKSYTIGQVTTAASFADLPPGFIGFCMAMFLSREDFELANGKAGDGWDYDAMRCEIATACELNDVHFMPSAIHSYSDSHAHGGGVKDIGPVLPADAGGGDAND